MSPSRLRWTGSCRFPRWEGALSPGGGGRGVHEDGDRSRPVNLNPVQALSDWDVEDFLSCLTSFPASSNVLNSSNPCLVHHDHTYSLPQEHVTIDLGESEVNEF